MTESSPCFHSPLCVRIASHFRTGYSTAYGHPHPCVTNDCHSAIFCQTPSLWCSTAVFYTPNQPNIIHVIFSESVGSSRSRRGESRSRRELRGPLLGQFSERLSPLELHDSPLLEICHLCATRVSKCLFTNVPIPPALSPPFPPTNKVAPLECSGSPLTQLLAQFVANPFSSTGHSFAAFSPSLMLSTISCLSRHWK
jgi:hypothetical protein